MRPSVLMLHSRGCDDMAADLLEQRDCEIIVAYESVSPGLTARGIPHTWLFDELPANRREQVLREAVARSQLVREQFTATLREKYQTFPDGFWPAMEALVLSRLRDDFMNEVLFVEALRACVSQRDLRQIIVPQDICRDTKALTLEANRLGIPVIHLLHGFPNGATNLLNEFYGDKVAAFSERSAGMYRFMGLAAERIAITGNPYWDAFLRPGRLGWRHRAQEISGLEADRPTIVWAVTYTHALSEVSARYPEYVRQTADVTLAALENVFRRHPDWQLLIRPHPHVPDHVPNLLGRAREAGVERVWLDTTLPPQGALSLASLVICTQSNLGIEAIFSGLPVIDLVLSDLAQPVFDEGLGPLYLPEDGVYKVRRAEDLEPAIERLMTDPAAQAELLSRREDTLKSFNGFLDGESHRRFSQFALSEMVYPSQKATGDPDPSPWIPALDDALMSVAQGRAVCVAGRHGGVMGESFAKRGVRVVHETDAPIRVIGDLIGLDSPPVLCPGVEVLIGIAAHPGPLADWNLESGAWAPRRRGPWEAADDLQGLGTTALERWLCMGNWRLSAIRPVVGQFTAESGGAGDTVVFVATAQPIRRSRTHVPADGSL